MAPKLVLIKRDGISTITETDTDLPSGGVGEGGSRCNPDDIADGRRVADWPDGVHTIEKFTFSK